MLQEIAPAWPIFSRDAGAQLIQRLRNISEKATAKVGGEARAKGWQKYLKGKGHYAGAIDGIYGPGTRRGLMACARDPAC